MDISKRDHDLLQPITQEEQASKKTEASIGAKGKKRYTPIVPVPIDAPPFDKNTCRFHNGQFKKEPDHIYEYRLADSSLAMLMVRWNNVLQGDGTLKKEMRPYIFGTNANGKAGWYSQSLDNPPLYNLTNFILAKVLGDFTPSKQGILFVEGEKTAEAAKILFPDYYVTTTVGGSKSAHKTDFSYLRGHYVLVAPDCGDAGSSYADEVYKRCGRARARRIQKFDTLGFSKLIVKDGKVVERDPDTNPAKPNYDLADALADGWTPELMAVHRDKFIDVYLEKDCEVTDHYKLTRAGVYLRQLNKTLAEQTGDWIWISPYLKVTHQIKDRRDHSWSKLVVFYDPEGHMKRQAIANEMLAGDGKELREQLAKAGFSILPKAYNRNHFNEYIHFSNPKSFAVSIKKVGWCGEGAYVLPDKIYGDTEGQYIQQLKHHHTPQIDIKGDLKGWQENIAKYAQRNSRLIMAITIPLAAPFLTPLQIDGHIFNIYGNSSIGKSSALAAACSVTGFEMNNFLNTNNSFESVFVSHNDACVVIDEMGLARPDKIGEFVYVVVNGKTKGRANQKGDRVEPTAFKTNGIVSSETTLSAKMGETGHKTTAGQEARFVDIPADAGRGFGIFEDTHGMPPEQLSDYLRQASVQYKGTAFDSLLEHLTSHTWDSIAKTLNPTIGAFKVRHLDALKHKDISGQVHRVLSYFALHAAAGEYCIQVGILPWEAGTVATAYDAIFREWLGNRGNGEPRELAEVIDNINKLCQQQISRFDFEGYDFVKSATNHSRAGVMKKIDGTTVFYVFPQVFKNEVMEGKDPKVIIPELIKRGILKVEKDGRMTIKTRIDRDSNPTRMYCLTPSGLQDQDKACHSPSPL